MEFLCGRDQKWKQSSVKIGITDMVMNFLNVNGASPYSYKIKANRKGYFKKHVFVNEFKFLSNGGKVP